MILPTETLTEKDHKIDNIANIVKNNCVFNKSFNRTFKVVKANNIGNKAIIFKADPNGPIFIAFRGRHSKYKINDFKYKSFLVIDISILISPNLH